MGTKNYGPAVSGFLDSEGRNWENPVFQAGKPVLDKELNLSEDIANSFSLGLTKQLATSGWLTADHLNKSNPTAAMFVSSATVNTLVLANNLKALVNGWFLDVASTGNLTLNQISLGAGPVGNGAKRTDLVILEVWRKLVSASPSTDGKSPLGRIWKNGNVKIQAADDAVLNFADDILDAVVASETAKRVQIQYRLRVISGIDLFAYPAGIDDPAIVANSTPAGGVADGVATLFTYTNQSANGDPGLWRAGDGVPSNTISSVDGYIYAIPLCAVFRRNTTAWDRNLNQNGGAPSPGPSTRPDGYLTDVLVQKDVVDLRQVTSVRGWENYQEIGEKNFNFLLDNALKTEWGTSTLGGGSVGHTFLWADEIGILPGDSVTTGDTPGAQLLGQFDCTRRFISDRSIYEVLTFKVAPGDPQVSTGTWQAGTIVTVNPTILAQYPFSGAAVGFINRAPAGTRILDLLGARIGGVLGGEKYLDVGIIQATAPATTSSVYPVTNVTGLGAYPPGNVAITLGTPPIGGLTTEAIYIDFLVAYPSGAGLSKTPTADFGAASFEVNNPIALTAGVPVSYAAMQTRAYDYAHREAQIQYKTSTITTTFSAYSTINPGSKYLMPERVLNLVQVRVNGGALPGVGGTVDASGRLLTLVGGTTAPGDVVAVDYEAIRPMPQCGVQMTLYYEARAAQTVRSSLLGTSQVLQPRWVSPFLYVFTSASGSQGESYPFPYGYVQTGGLNKSSGSFTGEHELDGPPEIFISDFNASTGFLRVPVVLPYSPTDEVTLTRALIDADIEDRTYFTGSSSSYKPSAFAQSLSDERVHKVVLPMVMETTVDTTLGRKGTLVLVLLSRWAEFDSENSVKFLASGNSTTASIFRLSGNLLNRRI